MIKEITLNDKFPDIVEWNKIAKKYGLLNSESIKYISLLDWKMLEIKINRETKMPSYQRYNSETEIKKLVKK